MVPKFRERLPFLLVVVIVLILDRSTKWLIDSRLALNKTLPLVDGLLNITYVRNTGVAFGILDPVHSSMKSTILSILTIGAIAAVVVYCLRTPTSQTLLQIALSLVLGGALGNLFDRVRYGYVIDFIEAYYRNYRWPAFNVADSAITTGVALLAIELFRKDPRENHQA
jgi:signal peptidase II